jgi:hypothetical protein
MASEFRFMRGWAAATFTAWLAAASPVIAHAQGYAIPWSNLDGAGPAATRLTAGALSLAGTFGQPDAGTLSGGAFTVQGGFWGIPIPRLLAADAGSPAMAPNRLSPARPNPFGASTEVEFALAHDGAARLEVFDVAGQRVRTLVQGAQAPGIFHVHWDGADDNGHPLAAGIYFLRLDAGSVRTTQRVVSLR